MEGWIRDVRYALRSIAGAKTFAAVVIATLALGIGANTAVFDVLNAVVLEPLPYEEPEHLVRIYQSRGEGDNYWPAPAVVELRQRSRTVDVAAVYTYAAEGADLTDRAQPERVRTLRVSANYFRVLGVQPMVGHLFERDDERAAAQVAVVSERIWRSYFDAASDVEGRLLSLNGVPFRVAAVLPAGFDDPLQPDVDVWTPVSLRPGDRGHSWINNSLSIIGRLQPGATLAQARAELAALTAALPWTSRQSVRRTARVAPLQADTIGGAGPMLWILLGAVGLLLIIACVNVASLFLARGTARESEMAVRAALGCSRWRMVRQLLVESLVLSLAGGLAGVALASGLTRTLAAAAPERIAHLSDASGSLPVLLFSFAVAVLSGIGFGVAPALQFARADLEGVLRESSRGGSGSRRHTRARNALVVCQMALALVLLCSAGLLLRSFEKLRAVGLGVQPAGVLTFQVHLPTGRYADPAHRARFHRELHDRMAALPGVRAAGAVSRLPVTGSYHSWPAGRAGAAKRLVREAEQRVIEGGYFAALGIPVLRGRTFAAGDDANAPRRVVVSRDLARQLFGDEDPIGAELRVLDDPLEIIGVVGDVAIHARGTTLPTVYHSHQQFAGDRNWALTHVVALDRSVLALVADLRRELAAIDPGLVFYQPRMLADVIGGGIANERFALLLIAAFALLALVLAAVGTYGVLSYSVTRRTREIGIRMALGAPAGAVWSLVVRDGGRLAAAGVALGLGGSYVATRALESLLFGVSATDPMVFAAAALTMALIALVASWIPARAATHVDPLEAVRVDA